MPSRQSPGGSEVWPGPDRRAVDLPQLPLAEWASAHGDEVRTRAPLGRSIGCPSHAPAKGSALDIPADPSAWLYLPWRAARAGRVHGVGPSRARPSGHVRVSITSPGRVQFSQDAVRRFADWSHDRNPLHVDPVHARDTHFGRPVVHGMLTALETLSAGTPPDAPSPTALDIEFRGAVFGGRVYDVDSALDQDARLLTLRGDDGVVLTLRVSPQPPATASHPTSRGRSARRISSRPATPTPRRSRLSRSFSAVLHTRVLTRRRPTRFRRPGRACCRGRRACWGSAATSPAWTCPVCGRCSRGRRAVPRRATDEHRLVSRTTMRFDRLPHAGHGPSGRHLRGAPRRDGAASQLRALQPGAARARRSRGRFVPRRAAARPDGARLGGSRGLGAEITAALALAGCHVYAAREATRRPRELFERGQGGRVEFLPGDVATPRGASRHRRMIRATHGRLDVVVLNACAPPQVLRLGPETRRRAGRVHARQPASRRDADGGSLTLLEASAAASSICLVILCEQAPAGFSTTSR